MWHKPQTQIISKWFQENLLSPSARFRWPTSSLIPESSPHFTSYFILQHATQPKITSSYKFKHPQAQTQLETFWTQCHSELFQDSATHRMFHFRITNTFLEEETGSSIHDFVIEKINDHFILYQSSLNHYHLHHWLSNPDEDFNGYPSSTWNSTRSYQSNLDGALKLHSHVSRRYGRGYKLPSSVMHSYILTLEKGCSTLIQENMKVKLEQGCDINQDLYDQLLVMMQDHYWENWIVCYDDPLSHGLNYLSDELNPGELTQRIIDRGGGGVFDASVPSNAEAVRLAVYCANASFEIGCLVGVLPDTVDVNQLEMNVYDFDPDAIAISKQNTFGFEDESGCFRVVCGDIQKEKWI